MNKTLANEVKNFLLTGEFKSNNIKFLSDLIVSYDKPTEIEKFYQLLYEKNAISPSNSYIVHENGYVYATDRKILFRANRDHFPEFDSPEFDVYKVELYDIKSKIKKRGDRDTFNKSYQSVVDSLIDEFKSVSDELFIDDKNFTINGDVCVLRIEDVEYHCDKKLNKIIEKNQKIKYNIEKKMINFLALDGKVEVVVALRNS